MIAARKLLAPVVLLLAGCAHSDYATFVTKTTLSVLDVDTTPVEAHIAFGRTEGYVGPRFADGSVYPVTGYLNAKGSALSRETMQVFAGGDAALLVQGLDKLPTRSRNCQDNRDRPPLFFATGTTVGLRVGFAAGTPLPNSFTFGYRRKEATAVPVAQGCQPSVFASHDSDAGARAKEGEAKATLGLVQYFATGSAADLLARSDNARDTFRREARIALTGEAAFNDRERLQLRATADTLKCAAGVRDADFDAVVVNARELGLLPEGGAKMVMDAPQGPARREKYAELLALRAGADDERTTAMNIHVKRVCALRKPG